MSQDQNIQVFVRCRPLNSNEKRSVVETIPEKREIKVLDRNSGPTYEGKNFYFDQVFAPDAVQYDVYKTVVRPLIDQVLMGFNCTVFAYGQTGTGKTYTMEGDRSDTETTWEEDPHSGIIPRAISQLFDTLKDQDNEFTVRVSFLELYNEDTYDLLSPMDDTSKLKIFEGSQKKGSVVVGGLEEIIVQSKAEIYDILQRGSAKRRTAATLLNACSSRSHTIFSVTVHIREGSIEGEELLKIGKLNLVDLAGSENIGRSGAADKRAREAGNINQSLLTLGRVITALVEKRPHIPYRESKLTRLLQDSLGGKTKTSIIATVSPSILDVEDTLSTLDYASRAKKITNKPEMNQRLTKRALLRELTSEIERLRRDLQAAREKNGIYIDEDNYKDMCRQLSAGNTAVQEKEDKLNALQDQLEKSQKLFENFTLEYEKTKAELDKARNDCERHRKLIDKHQRTEKKLANQASEFFKVAQTATNDNTLLHSKKDRVENLLQKNRKSIEESDMRLADAIKKVQNLTDIHIREFVDQVKNMIDKILHDYVDDVTKLDKRLEKIETLVEQLKIGRPTSKAIDKKRAQFESDKTLIDQLGSSFNSRLKQELGAVRQDFHELISKELQDDIKTGLTPLKKNYNIPKRLMLYETDEANTTLELEEDDEKEAQVVE